MSESGKKPRRTVSSSSSEHSAAETKPRTAQSRKVVSTAIEDSSADREISAERGASAEHDSAVRGRSVSSERRQVITTDARQRYFTHPSDSDDSDSAAEGEGEQSAESAQTTTRRPMSPAKKRALVIVVSVVACAAIVACCWLLFFSQYCKVTQDSVSINGMGRWVDSSAVTETLGQADGTSIALVSDSSLEAQLGKIRGVQSADISKSLPNKLTVTIHPRVAQAAVQVGSGALRVVDEADQYLGTVDQPIDGVPVLKMDGLTTDVQKRALKEALKVLAQIPQPLHSILTQASAATQDSVTTVTSTGYTIIWGDSSQMPLKVSVAEHLIADTALTAKQRTLDVSVPTKPIVSAISPQQAQQEAEQKAAAAAAAQQAAAQAAAQAQAQKKQEAAGASGQNSQSVSQSASQGDTQKSGSQNSTQQNSSQQNSAQTSGSQNQPQNQSQKNNATTTNTNGAAASTAGQTKGSSQ